MRKREPRTVTVHVTSLTVARSVVVIAATVVLLLVLWALRGPIVWLLIALLLATALSKPVNALSAVAPRPLAILAVYIVLVLVPIGLLLLTISPLVDEAAKLIDSLPELITSLQSQLQRSTRLAQLLQGFDPLETLRQQAARLPQGLTDIASLVATIGLGALNSIVAALTILVLSVFLVSSGSAPLRKAIDAYGGDRTPLLHRLVDRVGSAVAAYFAGTLLIAVVAGVTAYVAMSILDIPYAVALGVFCGVASLIPMFGATIAAVVVGVIAALTTSWTTVLLWAIWQLVYQQIENNLVQPQIQRRTVQVPPVLTVIGVLFGSALLGVLGAIIAIPTIAALIALAQETAAWRRGTRAASATTGD